MPKQGGPYSRASTSTLGTLGPSKQIGLISLEGISCIPPFNLEINIALLVGVEEANSVAIHRLLPIASQAELTASSVLVGG